ncbi:TatD family hydrolase [Thiomicrorhabdus sp.]|uniref:TatD family hydrolase n=1 Tax=Thiomicrorhabdus sp. TaxID=2039724 RepID=UPI002AA84074|nr:TatD family hydrolase [Thiomicrorhabdus sp.]
MFDTHCHLNSYFNTPLDFPDSINSYLAVSTQVDDWLDTIKFASQHHNVLAALGIHPWFVKESYGIDLVVLKSLISEYGITAIGEIGLDFNEQYKKSRTIQIQCFEQQLQIAESHQLPLSLHCVKAHNEMLGLLKGCNCIGVVHGLGTSVQIAQQYIDLGFKFGVNAVAVRENAKRYHALIKRFGVEHIVLETDYPNINLPGLVNPSLNDIHVVAKTVANILCVSVEDVIQQTDYNAEQIFKRNVL